MQSLGQESLGSTIIHARHSIYKVLQTATLLGNLEVEKQYTSNQDFLQKIRLIKISLESRHEPIL